MTTLHFFHTSTIHLTGDAPLLATMADLWAAFVSPAEAAGHAERARSPEPDAHEIAVSDIATACAEVNRAAVDACPLPAVHAGVVAMAGQAVVFPATSGAGKSTLTAATCLAGAGYLSDEALVLDDTGAALPYPKPLALSPSSLAALGLPTPPSVSPSAGKSPEQAISEYLLAPSQLPGLPTGPTPVGHIVLPSRVTGADPVLEPLPRRDGLAALLRLSFNHYRHPRRFLTTAAATVRNAQVWSLTYAEARPAATLLLDALWGE